jgi:hypothetical protein
MPGIDGLETLRRLRARESEAVVIMVTAYASIELAVDAMKLGAIDFVRKPMSPETLRAAVDAALAKAWGGWPAQPSTPAAAGAHRLELWSMNGFRIRHVADGAAATDNVFEVGRGRTGPGRQVAVDVARSVVNAASAEAGRSLDDDRTFWTRVGGIALLRHLWTHAETPPGDRLVLDRVSEDVLKAARRVDQPDGQ